MEYAEELRSALPQENQSILDLFSAVPMEGDLVLVTRRDPNFFGLYEMQQLMTECLVTEPDANGAIHFVSTFLIREGWLNKNKQRVGYIGDLRTRFSARRQAVVSRLYHEVFEKISAKYQCSFYLTSILESNQAAIRALVERKNPKRQQPDYHFFRRFSATSIHFLRKRKRYFSPYTIRTAEDSDLDAIVAFLDQDHRERPFGYCFDQGEFQNRLKYWPGFTLKTTYLAYNRTGKLVGCVTAWDPSAVKRYQVNAYRGSMVWTQRSYNLLAKLLRFPPLPSPGEMFRYFYLCNLSILEENPEIFRALLEEIYKDFYLEKYHFFTICIYDLDPLQSAVNNFFTRNLPFHLYLVTQKGNPVPEIASTRSGFEIALA